MDGDGLTRLAIKGTRSAIVSRIANDFGLERSAAFKYYERIISYFTLLGGRPSEPGEICYLAVADDEPPGKAISACRMVRVRLELMASADREALREGGLAAMRRQRLARLTRQARVQDALLTVEDLAWLTCSSTATVKRDLLALREAGQAVPTRGQARMVDTGPARRFRVVQLYLRGVAPKEIERRTGHPQEAIAQLLCDFRKVAAMFSGGVPLVDIAPKTGNSAVAIAEFVGVYERARRESAVAPRLDALLGLSNGQQATRPPAPGAG